ncbi:MAG: undecaprenyl-diphosphate phosphatase [Candidatus Caldarchaeum sp.]
MDFQQAVLLGLIQGFAEWLPVSSEGLTTLVGKTLYGQSLERALRTSIWLHLGTLLAACVYFRRDLRSVAVGVFRDGQGRVLLKFLTTATLASAATAIPSLTMLRNLVVPDSLFAISIGLLILAVALVSKNIRPRVEAAGLTYSASVVVGLVQGLSIIPGISRSGVTIAALLVLGFGLADSIRLSYLLSIPATAGAQIALPLYFGIAEITPEMVAGAAAAMAVGLTTISLLIRASLGRDFRKAAIVIGSLIVAAGLLFLYLGG